MSFNAFQIIIVFFLLIGIGIDSLFLVSIGFILLYLKQQTEIKNLKSTISLRKEEENKEESEKPKENTPEEHSLEEINENYFNEKIRKHEEKKSRKKVSENDWIHSETDAISKQPELLTKSKNILDKALDFISGVDLITKVGSLIFLIGIGFLIKYTSSLFVITPEFKIGSGIFTGIAAFLLGLKLFKKYPRYGATLEGLGLGISYLSIYLGLLLYNLYSVNIAFASMVTISGIMIFISSKQDKEILSGFAFLGAFLAPLLASSDSGNIFLLTMYFLVINASILCIVFYKNWFSIVIEGFLLTFSTLSLWFLMNGFDNSVNCLYPLTAILVMYIYMPLRILTKDASKEKFLSVIICGTPAIISTLHYNLLPDINYIKSLSAIFFGLVYLLPFRVLVNSIKENNPNSARAYEIIGIVMLSFSILFVTNTMVSSIAWAFEATIGLWLATKQKEKWRIYFCLGILGFAIYNWLSSMPYSYGDYLFINLRYFGTMVMTGCLVYSAYLLREFKPQHLSNTMLSIGSLWFLFATNNQFIAYFGYASHTYELLLSIVMATMMISSCELQKRLNWKGLILVYEYMIILIAVLILGSSIVSFYSNQLYFDFIAPALITSIVYGVLTKRIQEFFFMNKMILIGFATLSSWLYFAMLIDGLYFDSYFKSEYITSLILSTMGFYILFNYLFNKTNLFNQLQNTKESLKLSVIFALMPLTLLLSIFDPNIKYNYLPVLSFVDAIQIITVSFIFLWWKNNKNRNIDYFNEIQIAFSGFLGATATILLMRIMHYILSIPYELDSLLNNDLVQAALTLLWASIGIFVIYYSTIKENDLIKKAGFIILAVVTLKLFIVDTNDNLSRIIAFIAVGALYLALGYWLQIKEKNRIKNSKIDE